MYWVGFPHGSSVQFNMMMDNKNDFTCVQCHIYTLEKRETKNRFLENTIKKPQFFLKEYNLVAFILNVIL